MKKDVIKEMQDMRYLKWSRTRRSSGTAGSFLKSYERKNKKLIYYKLSNYNSIDGIIGHECVNEIIVDRLLTILGIPHLSYRLIHALILVEGIEYDTYICASDDYKEPGESKVPLDLYYEMEKLSGELPYEFCIRNGWGNYMAQLLMVDYLILNRDRHGANIEVLKSEREHTIRLSPLYDHGLSLLFSFYDKKSFESFDVLQDLKVQSFVASNSAERNLSLILKEERIRLPEFGETEKKLIFEDLQDLLGEPMVEKIWEMILERMKRYEDICNH